VVIVGWNDTTATLKSITDTKGNTYVLATGAVTISGSLTQSIYYAKNIVAAAAGTNTVSVTFSTAAIYPDIRILETADWTRIILSMEERSHGKPRRRRTAVR